MNKIKIWDVITWVCILLVMATLFLVIAHVLKSGLEYVNYKFISEKAIDAGRSGGISNVIMATVYLTLTSLLIAVPISIAAAIYLQEYATKGRLLRLLVSGIETLAGVPSIVFGLFGFNVFVTLFGWSWSLLSGSATLALMALPILTRTIMESIRAVPNSYRDASLALGASKWTTIVKVVVPAALSGIITGVILAMGRIIGETAAVFLTFGSTLNSVSAIFDSGRTMPVHVYILSSESVSIENAYATATVLLIIIVALNGFAYLFQSLAKRRG
ncbi:phosphate ABC transporter permease PstA [Clostridium sp. 'deep sea']|uniref:phosphate ABC transporter permease PstA n=1 Tax=Clostridium sp. 'deep sea' TaxID=2779445 RepID=UPI0018964A51|nr:phosphate ABC transporter permease PstA [Clostridium sp. 'deep sea']QOR35749.1 phosphate ABC transporter permease PstA [Clostridium sp. 'deep sea']